MDSILSSLKSVPFVALSVGTVMWADTYNYIKKYKLPATNYREGGGGLKKKKKGMRENSRRKTKKKSSCEEAKWLSLNKYGCRP